jgi:putative FmdB family regulatory protein
MPLYEYRCAKCGKTFEVIRKFSDEPLTVHEECGGAADQLLSAPAFQLKGTGWYVTDYAKKKGDVPATSKPAEVKSGDSSSATESKSEAKTESKTEAKPSPASSGSGDTKPAASTTDSK